VVTKAKAVTYLSIYGGCFAPDWRVPENGCDLRRAFAPTFAPGTAPRYTTADCCTSHVESTAFAVVTRRLFCTTRQVEPGKEFRLDLLELVRKSFDKPDYEVCSRICTLPVGVTGNLTYQLFAAIAISNLTHNSPKYLE